MSEIEKLERLYEDAKNRRKGEVVEIGTRSYVVGTEPWEDYVESLRHRLKQLLQQTIDKTEPYIKDIVEGLAYIGSLVKLAQFEQIARIDPYFNKQWEKLKQCMEDPDFNLQNKDKIIEIITVHKEGEPDRHYLVLKEKEDENS